MKVFKNYLNNIGWTLVELQLAALLTIVIIIAAFSLYNSSRILYFATDEKVITSSELQYAIDHISKSVLMALGDKDSPSIVIPGAGILTIKINNNNPLTQGNYNSTVTYTYIYSEANGTLIFNDGSVDEPLVPKVKISNVDFYFDGNILNIVLKGYYRNVKNSLEVFSTCYPRLTSFR